MCVPSCIFQDGGTKACAVLISCQLTQSCAPTDKTQPFVRSSQLFFAGELYVLMHRIVYHTAALISRYVSYREKLYRCSPTHSNYKLLQLITNPLQSFNIQLYTLIFLTNRYILHEKISVNVGVEDILSIFIC